MGRLNGEWYDIAQMNFYQVGKAKKKAFIDFISSFKGHPHDVFDEMIIEIPNKNINEVEDEPSKN